MAVGAVFCVIWSTHTSRLARERVVVGVGTFPHAKFPTPRSHRVRVTVDECVFRFLVSRYRSAVGNSVDHFPFAVDVCEWSCFELALPCCGVHSVLLPLVDAGRVPARGGGRGVLQQPALCRRVNETQVSSGVGATPPSHTTPTLR